MTEKRGSIIDWCLCRDDTCESWAAYVEHFTQAYGYPPGEDDVELDNLIQSVVAEMAAKFEASGSTDPARDAIAALFRTGGAS